MSSGRYLSLAIIAAAVVAAGTAIWYQSREMRRVIEAISPSAADRIVHAPNVELLRLAYPSDPGALETIRIEDRLYAVTDRRDLARARGLIHVRAALVHDASYRWQGSAVDSGVVWQYVLRFFDSSSQTRLAFDLSHQRMAVLDHGTVLSIEPIAKGLTEFFDEQFSQR